MNSGGRVCWRGVAAERLQPATCACGINVPIFDIHFPSDAAVDFTTAAPSAVTQDSGVDLASPAAHTDGYVVTGGSGGDDIGGGGGGGGGGDTNNSDNNSTSAPIFVGGDPTPQTWIGIHPRSVQLLIGASVTLFIIILFLGCIIFCFTRKKKKKRQNEVRRPETEGCEAGDTPYDVTTPKTPNNQNEFPLLQIDELYPTAATSTSSQPPPNKRDASAGTDSPFVVRNFPMLRTVKATIIGNGPSPKKTPRPVSRHDSTAPLVDYEAVAVRDKWKERSRTYGTDDNNYRNHSSRGGGGDGDRLSPLNEVGNERRNSKEPTKLEILPTRLFPASSRILESPTSRRTNKRPDSSTPLFEGDSIDSSEA